MPKQSLSIGEIRRLALLELGELHISPVINHQRLARSVHHLALAKPSLELWSVRLVEPTSDINRLNRHSLFIFAKAETNIRVGLIEVAVVADGTFDLGGIEYSYPSWIWVIRNTGFKVIVGVKSSLFYVL